MATESAHDLLYNTKDYSSYANYQEVVSTDIKLDWTLDFDKKQISGSVDHVVKVLVDNVSHVHFDSRKIHLTGDIRVNNEVAKYTVANEDAVLGAKISVEIPAELRKKDATFSVHFPYFVDPDASAVQWLEPAATKGGKFPYVFTQCQAIHARSLFPCMDSPGVKTPYTARVVAPKWCTVLMSALSSKSITDSQEIDTEKFNVFYWTQPVPTSPYLVALAGGNLTSLDISSRVRIWSEPEVIEDAHNEFAETEDFVQAAEIITGCGYQWTRYDVVCLPPSFPYGGMENPCLTFATPTLLAGDRSLADVIAHEIAHSWTGNLVTNTVWDHFWLNEGWTVWLERKITSRIKRNEDAGRLSSEIGLVHLHESIEQQGKDNKFTQLVWPLRGEDPDDAFSSIPYEKGFNLLNYLENLVGGENFDTFVKAYIQEFKFKTVTTGEFRDLFVKVITAKLNGEGSQDNVLNSGKKKKKNSKLNVTSPEVTEANQQLLEKVKALDWEGLFLSKGFPDYPIDFKNSLSIAAKVLARHWIEIAKQTNNKKFTPSKSDMLGWSSQQTCLFLDQLLEFSAEAPFALELLEKMGDLYGFNKTKNAEICLRWQSLALKSNAPWIVPSVISFITSQGRMKFVRPLYRLFRSSQVGAALANDVFEKNKLMYHPIARKMLESDLKKLNDLEKQQQQSSQPEEVAKEEAKTVVAAPTPVTKSNGAEQTNTPVVQVQPAVSPSPESSPVITEQVVVGAVDIPNGTPQPANNGKRHFPEEKKVEEVKAPTIAKPAPVVTTPIADPLWEKTSSTAAVSDGSSSKKKETTTSSSSSAANRYSPEPEETVSLFQSPIWVAAILGSISIFSYFAFRRGGLFGRR